MPTFFRHGFRLWTNDIWILLIAILLHSQSLISTSVQENYADLTSLYVTYKDMLETALIFEPEGVEDFQPIKLDKDRRQVFVGARDKVYRLHASSLTELQTLNIPSLQSTIELCEMKGQRKEECHNFIRLLQLRGDKLYICGTNAFHPTCSMRLASDLSIVIQDTFSGIGHVPYDPGFNGTYIMTEAGELYTGSVTDFNGYDASILRIMPQNRILRTAKANNRWLNDPSFVSALEIGEFVYFFFRETAVELVGGCSKAVYARVARVCKNDIGGDSSLQDSWTTFAKARLNCSVPGPVPFNYDHLQSIYYSKEQNVVYGVFTTPENSIVGSAICAFNLSSIEKSFEGPYAYQLAPNMAWEKQINRNPRFNCQTYGLSSDRAGRTQRPLGDAQRYQLMFDAVQPNFLQPFQSSVLESYTHILVDVVNVKSYGSVNVMFVVTSAGLLKKYSLLPGRKVSCLIEVLELVSPSEDASKFEAKDAQISHESGTIFIGTQTSVMKIPTERCHRYKTRQQCVDSKDPYCGWDSNSQVCGAAPGRITSQHFWHQNIDGCPRIDLPVNGGFSDWSSWFSCPQESPNGESCLCRNRFCNHPKPSKGGQACSGPLIQVTNCTRHGNWSPWSEWSSCSATCGPSMRSRKRTCSDPSPAFGGRACLGLDTQTEVCSMEPCPLPTPPPVVGVWSEWAPWEPCSAPCNGGLQKRARICSNPVSMGGSGCAGCDTEYRTCNLEPCEEVRRWSNWTPWLQLNASTTGGVWLQRFKFACRARISDPKLLLVSPPRSQEKHCKKDSTDCADTAFMPVESTWSEWSAWSECSLKCGNGTQSRFRTCSSPSGAGPGTDCVGHGLERRQCNAHSCEAQWSCWSAFSPCSVTCGTGTKHRMRNCPLLMGQQPCTGTRVETEPCDMGPCNQDGYGEWSGWSACSHLGATVRIRPCISFSFCKGIPDAQMRRCNGDEKEVEAVAATSPMSSNLTLIVSVCGAFIAGVIVALALLFCVGRRQSNCLYVFVPKPKTLEIKAPPTPVVSKPNIYTPPPSLRNIHPVNNLPMNPITPNNIHGSTTLPLPERDDYDTVPEPIETRMTLLRNMNTMRTSMNARDYL